MNKILDVFSRVVCLILSGILFLVICVYLCLNVVPKIVNKENVSSLVKEVEVIELLNSNEIAFINDLYLIADKNNIDRNVIYSIFNSNEFKTIISNYYGEVIEALLYDKKVNNITQDQIVGAIENTLDRNNKELGNIITSEQKRIIMIYIEEKIPDIVRAIPTYDQLIKNMDEQEIKLLQGLLGDDVQTFLIIIMILIIGVMALIRWSLYRFAIWTGIATSLAGGLFLLISEFIKVLATDYIPTIINQFLQNNVFTVLTKVGTVTLIMGIVQIVFYVLVKKVTMKNMVKDY